MYENTLVLSCSSLITSSIYSIFVEYLCTFSDRPIFTQSDLRPSAGHLGWSFSVYPRCYLLQTCKEQILYKSPLRRSKEICRQKEECNYSYCIWGYKTRLLQGYIHHFKSDLINNTGHMRIFGEQFDTLKTVRIVGVDCRTWLRMPSETL